VPALEITLLSARHVCRDCGSGYHASRMTVP
jgi:hypothetical protein